MNPVVERSRVVSLHPLKQLRTSWFFLWRRHHEAIKTTLVSGWANTNTERERARAANGVERARAGSRFRKYLKKTLCIGFHLFRWFFLLSGMLMSNQRWSSCCTLLDGKTKKDLQWFWQGRRLRRIENRKRFILLFIWTRDNLWLCFHDLLWCHAGVNQVWWRSLLGPRAATRSHVEVLTLFDDSAWRQWLMSLVDDIGWWHIFVFEIGRCHWLMT